MSRTRTLAALAAALLLTGFAGAAEPATVEAKLDDLQRKLDRALERITALEKNWNTLEEVLRKLPTTDTLLTLNRTLTEIRGQMETLQTEVIGLRNSVAAGGTGTGPRVTAGASPVPGVVMGTVRVTNEYARDMTVMINGTAYVIRPGQARNISVPVGVFTYEVPGTINPFVERRT